MPNAECYLISADAALRAAVREQWVLAAPAGAALHETENLPAPFSTMPDVIILDAPLVNKKSLSILRGWQSDAAKPKIFLLGETDAIPEIDGEYNLVTESFSKPLRLGHLLARLQFHLQISRAQTEPFSFGVFRLEPSLRQAMNETSSAVIRLTEKETHLLEYLGRAKQPVTREELLAVIWGYDARIDTHTLETHIYRLRRKLDPESKHAAAIVALPGAYRLAPRAK